MSNFFQLVEFRPLPFERGLRLEKQQILHVHHAFLYISLPSLHDYDAKMPNFLFWEDIKKQRRNFLYLSELGYSSQEFNFRRIRLQNKVSWSNREEDLKNSKEFFQRRNAIYAENESTESHVIFGKVEFIRVVNLGNQFYQAWLQSFEISWANRVLTSWKQSYVSLKVPVIFGWVQTKTLINNSPGSIKFVQVFLEHLLLFIIVQESFSFT